MSGIRPPLDVVIADRFAARLKGMLGHRQWPADRLLWLIPCWAVHTFGLKAPIDVAFLARDGTVVRIIAALAPRRVALCWSAHSALELAAGGAHAIDLELRVRWPHRSVSFRRPLR